METSQRAWSPAADKEQPVAVSSSPSRLRFAGWLFVASLIPFVLLPVMMIWTVSTGALNTSTPFAKFTPEILARIQVQWILISVLGSLAMLCGSAAHLLVGHTLQSTRASVSAWLAIGATYVVMALSLFRAFLGVSVLGFTEPTLGDVPNYQLSNALGNVGFPLLMFAILMTSITLWRTGTLRRVGLILTILSAVLFLVMIPFSAFMPPFVFAFCWVPMGIGLLRRRE